MSPTVVVVAEVHQYDLTEPTLCFARRHLRQKISSLFGRVFVDFKPYRIDAAYYYAQSVCLCVVHSG